MNNPIHVSGTVGINVLEPSSDSNLQGKLVCMYDVHNANNYCNPIPGVKHFHIDEFLRELKMCFIIIEEPFIKEPLLTPIFHTEHVHKVKAMYDAKSIPRPIATDIRLNMLICSLNCVKTFSLGKTFTLRHFLAPIMSIYKSSNKKIRDSYKKAIDDPNNDVFSKAHGEKLDKIKKIKKEFYCCISLLQPEQKKQMIYLYKCMEATMNNFILLMKNYLDHDMKDICGTTNYSREPLNKEYPFNTIFISEYSNDASLHADKQQPLSPIKKQLNYYDNDFLKLTRHIEPLNPENIDKSDWMYQLEVLIDCTMEMFTVAKLLKEWKVCNVVYMGLVHMARISHWLKNVFQFQEVVSFGKNTDASLPDYLDELQSMDSCVEL